MYQVVIVEDDVEQAEALVRMIDGFPRRDELDVSCLSSVVELELRARGGGAR